MLWRPTTSEIEQFWSEQMTPAFIVARLIVGVINLVSLSVGLGKSTLAEALLRSPLVQRRFDFILYAAAQTAILDERVDALEPGGETLVLRPRPKERCGALDAEWSRMEARGCSGAARQQICTVCPEQSRCAWLSQLTDLDDYAAIMGTQAYFNVAALPLARRIGRARNPLVLLDEDILLTQPYKHTISRLELHRHDALLRAVNERSALRPSESRSVAAHLTTVSSLMDRSTHPADVPLLRPLPFEVAAEVQRRGLDRYGDAYEYIGNRLFYCLASRRFRDATGAPAYIFRPWLAGATVVLLSAELDPAIVEHRLGRQVNCIFPPRYTQHAGSKIYNIRDRRLSASYLPSHMASFATPFAQLIAREMESGAGVLVVTRKRLRSMVIASINSALDRIGRPGLRLVALDDWQDQRDEVPVITYGVQGINSLGHLRTVLCIGAYNVAPRAMSEMINDVHLPEEHLPIEVEYRGGLRTARVRGEERSAAFDDLAQRYLFQVEFNTANQAVGRVRHCTRPRIVVFCQQTELPYELEVPAFESFAGFRRHFGLETERSRQARGRAESISKLRDEGLTQTQVTEMTGLSLSTVKRMWRR